MNRDPDTVTEVTISFFKPTGFEDAWAVNTTDRGLAIRTVMAQYPAREMRCVNDITANLADRDRGDRRPLRLLEPMT
jgi:hypothetical protein